MSNQAGERAGGAGCGCLTAFVIGWFLYGGFSGGLLVLGFSIAIEILAIATGIIPVLGLVAYWFIAQRWMIPFFESNYGLTPTWFSILMFWGGVISCLGVNIAVTSQLLSGFNSKA